MSFGISADKLGELFEVNSTFDNEKWSTEKLAQVLRTSLTDGVSNNESDINARKEFFGENRIPEKPHKSFFAFCWDALQDATLVCLIVCGIISLILGLTVEEDKSTGWIEGASILAAVVIVVLVTAINDFQKDKKFRELKDIKSDVKVNIIRDGQRMQVSVYEVVVGDLVHVATGDNIVGDGVLVRGHDVKINNSSFTGETKEIEVHPNGSVVMYGGTQITAGDGVMLICAVGLNSQSGIISALVTGVKRKKNPTASDGEPTETTALLSPADNFENADTDSESEEEVDEDDHDHSILQTKLEVLALQIGYFGMVMAVITVLILVIRFCIKTYPAESFKSEHIIEFLHFFITGITVLVVAVPEGLPLAVTISLAFSVKKMLEDNNLVRHLDACETMGNATTICSDKTGTLTTNRMTVVQCQWSDLKEDCVDLSELKEPLSESVTEPLYQNIALNTTAIVTPSKEMSGAYDHVGNNTECALLQYMLTNGADYQGLRKSTEIAKMITFSSKRKRMSTIIELESGDFRVLSKGASEVMLNLCEYVLSNNGEKVALSKDIEAEYYSLISKYASQGLRTLALCFKDIASLNYESMSQSPDDLESNLVLIGIVGIQDPVRPEVPGAIDQCARAGIIVRMVTGDNIDTARAIAKDCGIIHPDDNSLVMEGPDFRKRVLDRNGKLNMVQFNQIWPNLRVLARSSPTDKHTLVDGLIRTGGVVAVTGDGTNDAPALKKANVGFAMGIQGTEVAKDASDIILMDDNFNSIVAAVRWGRNVYDSVSKFLQFQLTVNVVAILIAVVGACVVDTSPLTAVQMLWVNLIMDTLASLALATEPPTDELLERKPYARDKAIISRKMLRFIAGHGLFQSVIVFGMTFWGQHLKFLDITDNGGITKGPTVHFTMVFNVFVLLQLVNEINARKVHGEWNVFKGILSNWMYIAIMVGQFLCQVIIVQFGGIAFSCVGLSWKQWAFCLVLALLELPWNLFLTCLSTKILPAKAKVSLSDTNRDTVTIDGSKMWVRSYARVRTMVRVSQAFKDAGQSRRNKMKHTKSLYAPKREHLSQSRESLRASVTH